MIKIHRLDICAWFKISILARLSTKAVKIIFFGAVVLCNVVINLVFCLFNAASTTSIKPLAENLPTTLAKLSPSSTPHWTQNNSKKNQQALQNFLHASFFNPSHNLALGILYQQFIHHHHLQLNSTITKNAFLSQIKAIQTLQDQEWQNLYQQFVSLQTKYLENFQGYFFNDYDHKTQFSPMLSRPTPLQYPLPDFGAILKLCLANGQSDNQQYSPATIGKVLEHLQKTLPNFQQEQTKLVTTDFLSMNNPYYNLASTLAPTATFFNQENQKFDPSVFNNTNYLLRAVVPLLADRNHFDVNQYVFENTITHKYWVYMLLDGLELWAQPSQQPSTPDKVDLTKGCAAAWFNFPFQLDFLMNNGFNRSGFSAVGEQNMNYYYNIIFAQPSDHLNFLTIQNGNIVINAQIVLNVYLGNSNPNNISLMKNQSFTLTPKINVQIHERQETTATNDFRLINGTSAQIDCSLSINNMILKIINITGMLTNNDIIVYRNVPANVQPSTNPNSAPTIITYPFYQVFFGLVAKLPIKIAGATIKTLQTIFYDFSSTIFDPLNILSFHQFWGSPVLTMKGDVRNNFAFAQGINETVNKTGLNAFDNKTPAQIQSLFWPTTNTWYKNNFPIPPDNTPVVINPAVHTGDYTKSPRTYILTVGGMMLGISLLTISIMIAVLVKKKPSKRNKVLAKERYNA